MWIVFLLPLSLVLGLWIGYRLGRSSIGGRRGVRPNAAERPAPGPAPPVPVARETELRRLAHELRSPIAALLAALDTQRRALERFGEDGAGPRRGAETLRTSLETARAAADRLTELVEALASAGRATPEDRPVAELVRAALALVHQELGGIETEIHLAESCRVRVVPGATIQILTNLLLNSAKALRGSGRIRITAEERGHEVELRLADTGPGVPPDLAERIFEDGFSRWEGGAEGEGIGLALSRELARGQGGDLRLVPSVPGATFVLGLPRGGPGA